MSDGFVGTFGRTREWTIATWDCKRLRGCLGLRLRRSLCRRSPKRWLTHRDRLCCGTLSGSDAVRLIGYCLRGGLRKVSAIRLQLARGAGVRHYLSLLMLLMAQRGMVIHPPLEDSPVDAQITIVCFVFLTRKPTLTM